MNKILDPNIKAAWIAALRSGKYIQGKEALEKDGCNCCLGVLCRILPMVEAIEYSQKSCKVHFKLGGDGVIDPNYLPPDLAEEIFGNESYTNPPISLKGGNKDKLIAISEKHGKSKFELGLGSNTTTLATLNDFGWTFPMIADVIEEFL
jgi:hypothetical protein